MTEQKQIQESEMRFRSTLEQVPVAICVMNGENHVVEVANEKQLVLIVERNKQHPV